MDQRKAALEFVGSFCRADASGLEPLLAEDFHLTGPLARFESRAGLQTFTFVDGKIADTLLLFDPGGIG